MARGADAALSAGERRRDLADSTVLLVGVGGLGSPLALALAAEGAGRLILVDDDRVDLSNLQRQILYRTEDVGTPKAEAARRALERRGANASCIEAVDGRFDAETAAALVARADVVCDGSDNLATKFLVNDVCTAAGRPFVVAGVFQASGQVLAVRPGRDACYRCLFDTPPADASARAATGVFGATCGEIAALVACAATALATGDDPAGVRGRLWLLEAGARHALELRRRPGCPACGHLATGEAKVA